MAPSLSLPKGGGAVRGIGEKFAANPVTGTGSLSLPLAVTPGRSGFGPQLTLTYDSGAGNGPFGLGWSLSIPRISRKTDKGIPRYDDRGESDTYVLSSAEDLVPLLDPELRRHEDVATAPGFVIHRYRPRVEGSFARIERWTEQATGDIHWRSITAGNVTTIYGQDDESRITDPAAPATSAPRRTFTWLPCLSYDDRGNAIVYEYVAEDDARVDFSRVSERNRDRSANRYLKRIRYGNRISRLVDADLSRAEWLFEVVLDYDEDHWVELAWDLPSAARDGQRLVLASDEPAGAWSARPDPFSSYRSGFELRTHRRCRRVLMFHRFAELGTDPCLVRSWEFDFSDLDVAATVTTDTELAHPGSTRFGSLLRRVVQTGFVRDSGQAPVERDSVRFYRYLARSLPPLDLEYTRPVLSERLQDLDAISAENLPVGVDGRKYQWVDLDGEGIPGVLSEQGENWFYKPNLGNGRFGGAQSLRTKPSLFSIEGDALLVDLTGDGRLDLVSLSSRTPGYFSRTLEGGWEPFRTFRSLPNLRFDDPNLRFVDLDGDGRPDVLITEQEALSWYPSLAADGFAPAQRVPLSAEEDRGPQLVFADASESVYLADLSGDGSMDLVRIRNGEICYWPNLGYGRFGAKVTMEGAPWFDAPDQFEHGRVRLVDIDGSGTTDIVYLGRDGARLYFNHSGNGWSAARRVPFPILDSSSAVDVVDLLGNGTMCLVWSTQSPGAATRPLRYVDLLGGQKPHLLRRTSNNLGGETEIEYESSTKFYLADKLAGKPWATRLPFPVHVVTRVTSFDRVSGIRFSVRFAYHHGFYDGVEREFRGFGCVEQTDTEVFEDYVLGVQIFDGTQEVARELYQPPVTVRSFYHTGAYLERRRTFQQLESEYYRGEALLPDSVVPEGLDPDELRECFRALKGLPIRREVFSFDGSSQQEHPYGVVENTFEVRVVQRRGSGRHAVLLPVPSQSVSVAYERNPDDPRITHRLTLEVDAFGNAKKSCAVSYGRRFTDSSLPAEVTSDQQRTYVTYSEADYTSRIDSGDIYRLPAPFHSRSFELTGRAPSGSLFGLDELRQYASVSSEIAYEVVADGVTTQKRLLAENRTLFLDDSLSPLPLGAWDARGLVHESYRLAFTPALLTTYYGNEVTAVELADAGYRDLDGDGRWWIPSGTLVYPDEPASHFFIPTGFRNALGLTTRVVRDGYDLLVEETFVEQALWHRTTATNDYRVLGPVLTTDANGNRTAVELDALGMVVKLAVMGKAGAAEGDTLSDPSATVEYDAFNWMLRGKPNFMHTRVREQHGAADTRFQESYAYANGSGGVVLTKTRVAPGEALAVAADGSTTQVTADPRWLGNGRVILNNKGKVVKLYEPYFSVTSEYESERAVRELGKTPIFFYDPVGRATRTVFPNGTLSRVELGPWLERTYDANDTVHESRWYTERGSPNATEPEPTTDSERRAAWLAAKHAGTPSLTHFDSLGRGVLAVSDYGGGRRSTARSVSDLTGRSSALFDEEGRRIAGGVTGLASIPLMGESAEKGRRWMFPNAIGVGIKTWNEHGRRVRAELDALARPVGTYVSEPGQSEILLNYVVYGDRHPDAQRLNLHGVVHEVFDQAGLLRVVECDFKGNTRRVERILAREYRTAIDWSALASQPSYEAVSAQAAPQLELDEVFRASSEYDALNRPTSVSMPDGSVVAPVYDQSGLLQSLRVQLQGAGDFVEFLSEQGYDARGQRRFARHGNGVISRYFYDPDSFRLTRLLSVRSSDDAETAALQDLAYTYDPVGNMTECRDRAQQTHYFNNAVVEPVRRYEYDALYQLVRATGREHASIVNDTVRTHADLDFVPQLPHANDTAALRNYTEEYEYDLLGNLRVLRHRFGSQSGTGNGWTRHYRYAHDEDPALRTNRLVATSMPGDSDSGPYSGGYEHDVYGNMTRMPHLPELVWDHKDQLKRVDLGGGGVAYYVYDSSGRRIRKIIERPGALRLERIYLGSLEIYREHEGDAEPRLERLTVHVADGTGTFAQVHTKTRDTQNRDPDNALGVPLICYQYTEQLGSVSLETNEVGTVVSYEEYHPYGTSAYRAARSGYALSLKRYRFSGKELDDETGFYYFGARYYAPWLGRWTSADPAGFTSSFNLFRYCANNPIMFRDPNGTQEWRTDRTVWTSLKNGGDNGGPVDTLPEFERWAVGHGVEYEGTPKMKGGDWVVGRYRFAEPGQGGARASLSPAEPQETPSDAPAAAASPGAPGDAAPGTSTSAPATPAPPTPTPEAPPPSPAAAEAPPSGRGVLNRIIGGVQLLGGVAEGVLAVGLLLAPEPTMATKVGGVILGAHSLDTIVAGARTLWSGEVAHTVTHQAGAGAARAAGASESTANWVGAGADIAAGVGPSIAVGLSRRALVAGAEATIEQGGKTSVREVLEGAGVRVGEHEAAGRVIGQATRETCVAASCRMIASDVGVELTESSVAAALNTTEGGASVLKAAEVLQNLGVSGGQAIPRAALPQLEAGLASGRSAMVGLNVPGIGPHAVVVDRIADGRVFLRDPLPRALGSSFSMPLGDFLSFWSKRLVIF